jgi:hypothetical protein
VLDGGLDGEAVIEGAVVAEEEPAARVGSGSPAVFRAEESWQAVAAINTSGSTTAARTHPVRPARIAPPLRWSA